MQQPELDEVGWGGIHLILTVLGMNIGGSVKLIPSTAVADAVIACTGIAELMWLE
jgi:hypothetical protein